MFGNLFNKNGNGKNDEYFTLPNGVKYRITRKLSQDLQDRLELSTLQIRATELYMHYYLEGLNDKNRDEHWRNITTYFWFAEEKFPKKSLPPVFETYTRRHFVFNKIVDGLLIESGKASPWFGMPGGGVKHLCRLDNEFIELSRLESLKAIEYLTLTKLSNDNIEILTDREHYIFLMDARFVHFRDNNFYIKETPISISVAYSIGGLHIAKKGLQ